MDRRTVTNPELLEAARTGLAATPKTLPSKWFYDTTGSALFERITELPEYYPTRTEIGILRDGADALAAHVPSGAALVELGSGASVKTRILLDRLDALDAYVPIDISAAFLETTAAALRRDYPGLTVSPIAGDFTGPLDMEAAQAPGGLVAFFPGSTIGNLEPDAAAALLSRVRSWPGIDAFIVGIDLVKDPDMLIRAYDDADGVTAEFNRNLLHRLNREAGGGFAPGAFMHEARWNAPAARIEMHLVSNTEQHVPLAGDEVAFAAGESIHTENSHKYTGESFAAIAARSGWRLDAFLTDAAERFAVTVLRPDHLAPADA